MTTMHDVPTTALSTAGTTATIHAQVAAAAMEECELLLLADAGEALVLNESAALFIDGCYQRLIAIKQFLHGHDKT